MFQAIFWKVCIKGVKKREVLPLGLFYLFDPIPATSSLRGLKFKQLGTATSLGLATFGVGRNAN